MKINEKWALFLIATVITFSGIVDFYVKGTKAVDMSDYVSFEDINFYNCVVDEYNLMHGTNVMYSTSLSNSELATLTSLSCSGRNITSAREIYLLTGLTNLDLSDNNLTSLDISHNTNLQSVDISNNSFSESVYIYEGKKVAISSNVKVPKQLNWSDPVYMNSNAAVAEVSDGGVAKGLSVGVTTIVGTVADKYTLVSTINVLESASDNSIQVEDNSYSLIFIIIIFVLAVINIVRIVVNKKNNN